MKVNKNIVSLFVDMKLIALTISCRNFGFMRSIFKGS